MLHLSEFVWILRSSVLVVFNNFLLIDATDRSKISSDQKRFFIALSLYPLSFFANTPFKEYFKCKYGFWKEPNIPMIKVIVSSDTVLSVRATVLLGQVLHLATLLLPHEIGSLSQCLPELADHIATNTQVETSSSELNNLSLSYLNV